MGCNGRFVAEVMDLKTFTEWKSYGINFTRIWFQNDGFNITLEGRYDAYSWPDDYRPTDNGVNIANLPKGTQINQRGAYEIDKIFESAEKITYT